MNDHIETGQRSTRANLPDVAPHGFLEVNAPPRMQSKTLGNLKVFSQLNLLKLIKID